MNEEQSVPASPNAPHIHQPAEPLRPSSDLVEYFRRYAHERPEVVALLCLGIGFGLGWKLKLW
jgi:hypothetical protein